LAKGREQITYSWGLNNTSINQVEELTLWKAVLIPIYHGDSMVVLHNMVKKFLPRETYPRTLLTFGKLLENGYEFCIHSLFFMIELSTFHFG
jgi:hypothetical protein